MAGTPPDCGVLNGGQEVVRCRFRWKWIAWGALVVIAGAVRFVNLGNIPGVNADEAWEAMIVAELMDGVLPDLATASGRLKLNPLYLLFCAPFQWLAPHSFAAMRAGIAVSGVLSVLLAIWVGRRTVGEQAGWLLAVLMAVSPPLIAYSRLAWDVGQLPLLTVPALYLALRGRGIAAAACGAFAVLVYPAGVFLMPVIAGALVGRWAREADRNRVLEGLSWAAAVAVCLLVAGLLLLTSVDAQWVWDRIDLRRLGALSDWKTCLAGIVELLTGPTTYQYVSGPVSTLARWCHGLVFVAVWFPVVWVGTRVQIRRSEWEACGAATGFIAAFVLLLVAGGPTAFTAGTERFALVLVVPALLILAQCAAAVLQTSVRTRRAWIVLLSGYALFCLVSHGWYFHGRFYRTGGSGEVVFSTGSREPKHVASTVITEWAGERSVTVIAQGWWAYWPLAYQLRDRKNITLVSFSETRMTLSRLKRLMEQGACAVGFSGYRFEGALFQLYAPSELRRRVIRDYAGKPVMFVAQVAEATSASLSALESPEAR